jgi:fructokinase
VTDFALVVGEALVDEVRAADGTVAAHPGGSPANVAIGLGRLGREVELLTWLGPDAYGTLVADHVEASGVRLAPGSTDAASTSVATAVLDATGAATYQFDLEWQLPAGDATPGALVVHTGSIAAVLEPGGSRVAEILRAARDTATITYDPNARPSLMGSPADALAKVESVLALSDVVKVSDEDIEWLTGLTPDAVAPQWLERGPRLIVVTRGGEGASAWTGDGRRVDVAAPRVVVADTVGAGDSFMGGLIDGLWSAGMLGASNRERLSSIPTEVLEQILTRCVRIAAITVSRAGANPPTLAELDAV